MSAAPKGAGPEKRDYFQIFLMAACVALAVLVFLLAMQNRRLKNDLAVAQRDIPEDALTRGDTLEPPALIDDLGRIERLDFGGERALTLLLVFSSTCPACEQTLPLWSEVIPEYMGRPELQIIGIQLDRPAPGGDPGSLVTAAFPFPIHGVTTEGHEALKRIPYIPAAILIDPAGVVQETWYGVPGEEELEALREALR